MKKITAILMIILLCLSFASCGNDEKVTSEEQTSQVTEVETQADDTEESDLGSEIDDESNKASEASTEIDFTKVEGLSDKYVDFENRAFAYNGKIFKLGESTLKDLIDGGIPFDERELNNKGNNVNSNYQTGRYTAKINDFASMQFQFINITTENKTEEECLLSNVRYYNLYVPQPDYDADRNAMIAEYICDASKKVSFSFPLTLTKEQLLENSSEGAQEDEYNNVEYRIDSEVYYGDSGYRFDFNKTTNQMEEVYISWLP